MNIKRKSFISHVIWQARSSLSVLGWMSRVRITKNTTQRNRGTQLRGKEGELGNIQKLNLSVLVYRGKPRVLTRDPGDKRTPPVWKATYGKFPTHRNIMSGNPLFKTEESWEWEITCQATWTNCYSLGMGESCWNQSGKEMATLRVHPSTWEWLSSR